MGLRWLCEAYVARARCRLAQTTRCAEADGRAATSARGPGGMTAAENEEEEEEGCDPPLVASPSVVAEEARQLELAAADVARAIALWPRDAVALSVLAEVREKQGLLSLAVDAYEDLLYLQPPAPSLGEEAAEEPSDDRQQAGVLAARACARALEDRELASAVRARQGRLAELRGRLEGQWGEVLGD